MVIRLSPTFQKYVEREAKVRGVKPSQLVEDVLKEHRASKRKPREQVSAARRQLNELARFKKKNVDSDAALKSARAFALKQYEDNVEFIEIASKRYSKPEKNPTL